MAKQARVRKSWRKRDCPRKIRRTRELRRRAKKIEKVRKIVGCTIGPSDHVFY